MKTTKDKEFQKLGKVISLDTKDILEYLENETPMPESNNLYVADDPKFREIPEVKELKKYYDEEIEAGYCNGYNTKLNCLEWHNCPEINLCTRDMVLFLGSQDIIHSGIIQSKDVEPFLIRRGEVILLYPGTLHFSPCRLTEDGFKCMVVLSKGTNLDLDEKKEDKLLFKKNKWLIAHPEAKQAKMGAHIGIEGINLEIK